MGGDSAHGAEAVARGEGFLDESEETNCGVAGNDFLRVQQETQTVCPLKETGFLPGESGRPRCASTCFLNSSEVIERREDKISCIRSSLMSGRTGDFGVWLGFTGHEDRAERVGGQFKGGSTGSSAPSGLENCWDRPTQGVALGYRRLPLWGADHHPQGDSPRL
jgi:hypothetical protein